MTFLSIAILSACSSSKSGAMNHNSTSVTNVNTGQGEKDSSTLSKKKSQTTSKQNTSNGDSSSDKPGNQLNLTVGDNATVKSNISKYNITLESANVKHQVNGQKSMLDQFVVAKVKIKNVGSKNMEIKNVIEDLQLTEYLKGSGTNDISGDIGLKQLKGTLTPGDTKEGQLVFDARSGKKYYLIDGLGLADKGAGLQNKVIWTFKASGTK